MGHVRPEEDPTWPDESRHGHYHFGFLPPDFAIASDDMLVDRSIVTAGGVMTAKRPHVARNARRSAVASISEFFSGNSAMIVSSAYCECKVTRNISLWAGPAGEQFSPSVVAAIGVFFLVEHL